MAEVVRLHKTIPARRATRSKTGCLTCRKRRVKCDEIRPICTGCTTQRFSCDWPTPSNNLGIAAKKSTPFRGQVQAWQHVGKTVDLYRRLQMATTIRPSLNEFDMECANSVTLTPRDRRFLEYFSFSDMYRMFNFGHWCTLQYLLREVAPSRSGVMRMVLAFSATEMHRKGFQVGHNSENPGVDLGLYHYNLALEYLHDCLAQKQSVGGEEDVEAIISIIFFMVYYEFQFSRSANRVKAHLRGLCAVINAHPLFRENNGDETILQPPQGITTDPRVVLCCQLILWLLYADIIATNTGASTSLFNQLTKSTSPFLEPNRLYKVYRVGISKVWGDRYPPSHLLSDMEIHRPLEFAHQLLSIRFNIWDLKSRGKSCDSESFTTASLLDQLLYLGEQFFDVINVAHATATIPWTQNMETITRIVACYWATILFHRRMLGNPGPQNELHLDAVEKATNLLFVHYEQENEKLSHSRLVWSIFIAAIETHDPIHRRWLLERLRDARGLSTECDWACATAEDILTIQTAPGTPWVDLAGYMQSQDDNIT